MRRGTHWGAAFGAALGLYLAYASAYVGWVPSTGARAASQSAWVA